MENNAPQKKQFPAFLTLTIIAVVAAVVLALTNMITAGPIAEHAMAALKEAFNAVMPAESYEAMTVPAEYEVASLYAAKNGDEVIGYCVTASSNGYGGPVAVTLGVDKSGVVTGCSVGDTNFAETAGFGARAKDASFQEQFPGISAVDGGAFEALSGATITSEAVRASVNKGLKCVAEVALGASQKAQVEFGAPAGKADEAEAVEPVGEVLTAAAPGFAGQDVIVNATMNADGTIATLSFDMSLQAPPVCDLCNTDEFKSQFIGKAGPFVKGEGIDIVSGATFTSEGIIAAVNKLYETQETFAEAPATVIAEGDSAALAVKADGAAVVTPVEGYTGDVAVNLTVENGQVTAGEFAAPAEEVAAEPAPADNIIGTAPGFQSDVNVSITLAEDGTIAALSIGSAGETPGFGIRCAEDETFINQFIGKKGPFAIGENVDALTGATMTSTAVVEAINVAMNADEAVADTTEEVVEEVPAETAAPAGETFTGTAAGFQSDVTVTLTVADGVITAITVDSSGETVGFGTRCAEDETFLNQFIGKKVEVFTLGENVDALTGATMTSQAVVNAINASSTVAATAEAVEAAPAGETLTGTAAGFQSDVTVTLTVADGVITAITVDSSGETVGFGTRCAEDEAFLNQFIGKKATPDLGEGIDALSGATMTSEAVVKAANAAIGVEEAVETTEEVVEEVPAAPAAEELTAAAAGFAGKDVGVAVTLNEDGTIATLTLDLTQQVPLVCDLCNSEDFLNQFIGKKGPFVKGEGVDIVTGATFTSDGVIAALNTLFPEEEKVEEAAAPAGEALTAAAPGFLDSEVGVTATLNADGTIATLTFDLSKQVPPAGDLCDSEDFKAQFIGKKGPFVLGEGVDAVTGATFTSEGVVEALNKLFQ
ncbi:MAG: FMN-binding protein [Clostridia bacterium]|nr:FMN-binding protein [Clostridia bacterium]